MYAFCRRFVFDWWHCGAKNCVKWHNHIIWEYTIHTNIHSHHCDDVFCCCWFWFCAESFCFIWRLKSNCDINKKERIIFYIYVCAVHIYLYRKSLTLPKSNRQTHFTKLHKITLSICYPKLYNWNQI